MISSKETQPLLVEREQGIVSLTLNRPARRNAIDVPLWRLLTQTLEEIEKRHEDRVVVLTGAGGTFCAGGDLSGAVGRTDAEIGEGEDSLDAAGRVMRETVGATCLALHRLSKPTLAAVEGTAAGAGANLALGCDLVLAGRSARFGEVFVRRALPVDSGGSWLLPRLVGLQKAKELAFFGDWIAAEEAARIGLVNRVVADGETLAEALAWARRLAASSRHALAWIKRGMNASFGSTLEQSLEQEARGISECVATPEFAEAMRSFLGRKP